MMGLDQISAALVTPAPTRSTLDASRARLAALVAAADSAELERREQRARSGLWRADAACVGHPPQWWWEPDPESGRYRAEAREICAGCPVRVECGIAGRDELEGLWGGMARWERQRQPRENLGRHP